MTQEPTLESSITAVHVQGDELRAVSKFHGIELQPPKKQIQYDEKYLNFPPYVVPKQREKLFSTAYDVTVTKGLRSDGGHIVTIVLTQVETGKTKTFVQCNASADRVFDHMLSLTDDLCSQWFNERPKKTKKEKVVEPT